MELKRILSGLLALCLCLTMLPAQVFAQGTVAETRLQNKLPNCLHRKMSLRKTLHPPVRSG